MNYERYYSPGRSFNSTIWLALFNFMGSNWIIGRIRAVNEHWHRSTTETVQRIWVLMTLWCFIDLNSRGFCGAHGNDVSQHDRIHLHSIGTDLFWTFSLSPDGFRSHYLISDLIWSWIICSVTNLKLITSNFMWSIAAIISHTNSL